MKFCKDCKYFYEDSERCYHKKSVLHIDMMTGHIFHRFCYAMRRDLDACGKNAELFEPSILYRIKNGFRKCFSSCKTNN